jgi:hypothetical protein
MMMSDQRLRKGMSKEIMDQLLLRKLNFSKAVEEKKGMVFCL